MHYMYFMCILYFLCFSTKVNIWSYSWVCHEKFWKSGFIAPLFHNLSITWRWVVSFVSLLLCWNLLNGMHCSPQNWSGCYGEEKICFVPTVNQTMIQTVAQSQYRVTYFISPFHLSIMTNCIVCQWIVSLFSILSAPLRMFVLKSVKNLLYVVSWISCSSSMAISHWKQFSFDLCPIEVR